MSAVTDGKYAFIERLCMVSVPFSEARPFY